jgi:hypothetical protein
MSTKRRLQRLERRSQGLTFTGLAGLLAVAADLPKTKEEIFDPETPLGGLLAEALAMTKKKSVDVDGG